MSNEGFNTKNNTGYDTLKASNVSSKDKIRYDNLRWIVLIILFIGIYSFVYCFNNPLSLQNELQNEYNLTNIEYGFLYSIYGYINLIFPLLSGILIDYININYSTIIFYLLILIGQFIWIIGLLIYSYPLMLIGRSIFGCGAESFHLSRKYLIYIYFINNEYSFSNGITLMSSRIASFTQTYITTFIYNKTNNIVISLSFGFIIVFISFIIITIFMIYIIKYNNNSNTNNNTKRFNTKMYINALWHNNIFDRRFWLLGMCVCLYYAIYLSFITISSSFLQNKYNYTFNYANSIQPIPYIIGAIFTPVFGYIIDRIGKRCQCLLISVILYIIAHLILGFTDENSFKFTIIIGITSLGFGYAISTAILWPCFGILYSKEYLPTCFGFWGSIDNGFKATAFLIVGWLNDNDINNEYLYIKYFYLFLCLLALIFTLLLWYYDINTFNNALNKKELKYIVLKNQKICDDNSSQSIPLTKQG